MARNTKASAMKIQRNDAHQKRKFEESDGSATRSHQTKRTPEKTVKPQTMPLSEKANYHGRRAHDGILIMEEDDLYDLIQLGRKVGSGNWATVYEAQIKRDGQVKAVKVVARCPDGVFTEASKQRFDALKKEYRILRTIPSHVPWHANIIRHDCFISTPLTGCLVAPLHDEPMTVCLPLGMLHSYCLKLASALGWLHGHYICHNDVKLANIVVERTPQDLIGEPIMIDFGFATDHRPGTGNDFWTQDKMGTAEYLSPERAAGRMHDERLSDIWALGISFFEMATGRTPFEKADEGPCNEETMGEYRRRIAADEWFIDEDLPPELIDLCRSMVHTNPRLRLSLADVRHHDFFRCTSQCTSDLENERRSLKQRDESFASSLEGEPWTSPKAQTAAPTSFYHATDTPSESSVAFPNSPALNSDDLSFEPNLIESTTPSSVSTDTSLVLMEDHRCTSEDAPSHSGIMTAPQLAFPINIAARSSLCTPHSGDVSQDPILQLATPHQAALPSTSHKANGAQTLGMKQYASETDTPLMKPDEFSAMVGPVRNGQPRTSHSSPKPARSLSSETQEQFPVDLILSAQRAEHLLTTEQYASASSVDSQRSDLASSPSTCSSFGCHPNDCSKSLGHSVASVVKTPRESPDEEAAPNVVKDNEARSSSCSRSIESCGAIGDEPTVTVLHKSADVSRGAMSAASALELSYSHVDTSGTTAESSTPHNKSCIELSLRENNAGKVRSLFSRLDEIEQLVREAREELSLLLSSQRQHSSTQLDAPKAASGKVDSASGQQSSRGSSRLSLKTQLSAPTLIYDADSETEGVHGRASSHQRGSVTATVSTGEPPQGHLPLSEDAYQPGACSAQEITSLPSGKIEAPLSSSCSRLSILCEDEQEEEQRKDPLREIIFAPTDQQGRSTSMSTRPGQPPPSSFSRNAGRLPFRAPTVPAASIEIKTIANDNEDRFVVISSNGGGPNHSPELGSAPAKLKRGLSSFRGRRTPSHDEREPLAAQSIGGASSFAAITNSVGAGAMNHSRSKSATLSSLFSFNAQQQVQQYKSESVDKLRLPSLSIDCGHPDENLARPSLSASQSARTPTPARGMARRRLREAQLSGKFGAAQKVTEQTLQTPKESGSLWKRLVPSKAIPQRTL